jgi:hypothetical protein
LRGKAWSIDEERLLRQLVQEGKGTEEISQVMGKTRLSIKGKLNNLRLSLVVATGQKRVVATTTTPSLVPVADSISIPNPSGFDVVAEGLKSNEPLPSVEQKLQALAAALRALECPGLRPTEISRLRNIIEGVKVYEQLFARYVNYCAIEDELVEVRKQLASERSHK